MRSRCMSLLPRTTLHSDSEHLHSLHLHLLVQEFGHPPIRLLVCATVPDQYLTIGAILDPP
jgi:hypothetical protein